MLSGEGLRCSEQQPVNHSNHQIKDNIVFIYSPALQFVCVSNTPACVFSSEDLFSWNVRFSFL